MKKNRSACVCVSRKGEEHPWFRPDFVLFVEAARGIKLTMVHK